LLEQPPVLLAHLREVLRDARHRSIALSLLMIARALRQAGWHRQGDGLLKLGKLVAISVLRSETAQLLQGLARGSRPAVDEAPDELAAAAT